MGKHENPENSSCPFPCRERGCGRNTKPRIRQTAPAAFHQIRFSLSLESSFFSIISMMPLVKAGKVKALAVTSSKRSSIAPDIPTAVEAGYPGLVHTSWYGVWAPKSMTESKVQALNKAINTAVKELAGSSAFSNLGIEPVIETPSQFQKFVAADVAKSADLLKSSGYQPQ